MLTKKIKIEFLNHQCTLCNSVIFKTSYNWQQDILYTPIYNTHQVILGGPKLNIVFFITQQSLPKPKLLMVLATLILLKLHLWFHNRFRPLE